MNDLLAKEANVGRLSLHQKKVILAFDEMRIREDLVFNKHDDSVIGFVDLSNIDNRLQALEKSLSDAPRSRPDVTTHVLVVMVRGLCTSLRFPYAHFATTGATSEVLSSVLWEAVRQVEITGLSVVGMTGDGASCNRKFFRNSADPDSDVPYRAQNPYSEKPGYIYFFSDVPTLAENDPQLLVTFLPE